MEIKKYKELKFKKRYLNSNFKKGKFKYKGLKKKYFVKKSVLFSFRKRQFRIYDAFVLKRVKIIKRLRMLNFDLYKSLVLRYQNLRWLKDLKLINGLLRYKKDVEFFESQGLKRKVFKRRLSDYAVALFDKQKLKYFYIGIKEFSLRNIVRQVFYSKNNHLDFFVGLLESRLGTVLYRINLFSSLFTMKQSVKKGFILVNNRVIKNISYLLKVGDVISLSDDFFKKVKKNRYIFFKKRLSLFFYPSKYIEISFSLFNFLFYKRPLLEEVAYPFNINLSRVLSFYNKKGLR